MAKLQVRTDEKVKEQASAILEELGTNLSSVVNMLLKQIVLTKSIPFEIKLPQVYTAEEMIGEIQSSMAMENMDLSGEDIELLKSYQESEDREQMRKQLLDEYMEV
ncbi:MAG: type II toxin-antitoxin system RelB/DinJ family antitoxin [Lacrimispora sp.]|uniref:type II toxin-antitoxin system RelB/DinJ family antitoxin n=1 Tax=Lacrimispora sp. TaxID=2719234 RepID=UPI0039E319A0